VEQADETLDNQVAHGIKEPDKDTDHQHTQKDHQGILDDLVFAGPNDLFQLGPHFTEPLAQTMASSTEKVFVFLLFSVCHLRSPPLLSLGVHGVLSAKSAVFLHFETVGVILLVLHGVVVPLLALVASQSHFNAHFGTSLYCLPVSLRSEKFDGF
jgi:hypothetical protein